MPDLSRQPDGVITERFYRRLVARGERYAWTADDERRLRERCERLRQRSVRQFITPEDLSVGDWLVVGDRVREWNGTEWVERR